MAMPTIVEAPEIGPYRHGLVHSGNVITPTDRDWENGVTFVNRGQFQVNFHCIDCEEGYSKSEAQACGEPPVFVPHLLELSVEPYAPDPAKLHEIARETVDVGTSARLEDLTWFGCAGSDTPSLSDGESLSSAANATVGLGQLMGALISATGHAGSIGTIHMSPTTAISVEALLVEENGILRTRFGGHKVIVGNYPDDTMAGHIGEVDVYLSEVTPLEPSDSDVARGNTRPMLVERLAVAVFNTDALFLQPFS